MCTVSIKVNDNLLHRAWANMDKDVDMAEWMQQQIEAILLKMALDSEREEPTKSHWWDDYELSPEILAMMPEKRIDFTQRIKSLAKADGNTISLRDLEGILPDSQKPYAELLEEYLCEKYGI